jgi:prepilin-type N-terminal cleavage/methylation domain-containing protein
MKLFNNNKGGQRGFTLIELIVVIAILGTLSAIAVPLVTSYLSNSKERAYDAEQSKIQAAVNLYYGAKGNSRFIGKRVYPVLGKDQTVKGQLNTQTSTLNVIDDRLPFNTSTAGLWSPLGGTAGADLAATSVWVDDSSDGVRDIGTSAGSSDSWNTVEVTRSGSTYYVDPRYYLVDFDILVTGGFLQEVPASASEDNKPVDSTNSYTGSYIWYVDDRGTVQSLYMEFPDTAGHVEGVFP